MGNNISELPENYFDLVYSISVIEHVPDDNLKSFFDESVRILKPGGIVSHSYDIYYKQNTKKVFDAYENSGLQWLKTKRYNECILGRLDRKF
jgi:cyclopropane fatty-acyl-phospholipid synthase-like methyltransferase